MIDILYFGAIFECNGPRLGAEVDNLLLNRDVRMCERFPAEVGNWITSKRSVDWVLRDRKDFVEKLV